MKNSLSINSHSSSYTTSCKYRSDYLNTKIIDTFQRKKKEKKLFDEEQIVLEMHN